MDVCQDGTLHHGHGDHQETRREKGRYLRLVISETQCGLARLRKDECQWFFLQKGISNNLLNYVVVYNKPDGWEPVTDASMTTKSGNSNI